MELVEYARKEDEGFHRFTFKNETQQIEIAFFFTKEYKVDDFKIHQLTKDVIAEEIRDRIGNLLVYVNDNEERIYIYEMLRTFVKVHELPITVTTVPIPNKNAIIISCWKVENAFGYIEHLLSNIREGIETKTVSNITPQEENVVEETEMEEVVLYDGDVTELDDGIEDIEDISIGVVEDD